MKILVLGAGEVGVHLARVLSRQSEVVLVDRKRDALEAAEDVLDALTVLGDITHRKVLQQAGAAGATLVVAVTGSDDANLIGAALAAELGAARTVARVDDASFYQTDNAVESGVLGIHAVLCAARLVGDEILRLVTEEEADSVLSFCRNGLQVASVAIKEFHPACGKGLSLVPLPKGCAIALVARDGQPLQAVDVARLELGDVLVLAGRPDRLVEACRVVVGGTPRRGLIVGGGDVGAQLAAMLAPFEGRVQVIEKDPARAEQLAEQLPSVNVIRGDGSSIATLRDEHIETVDYVAALTRSDEVNLMVSLVARDLGVPRTYTLVHRPGYEEIYRHLGVHGTTGPHDVLAGAVERMLPKAGAERGTPLFGTPLECVEYVIAEGQLDGEVPPSRLSLPPGAFLLGRVEAQAGVVSPRSPLRAGQSLVVAAPSQLLSETGRCVRRLGGSA